MYNYFLKYGHRVCKLRTDYGTVERSKEVDDKISELKISISNAEPRAQYRNPVERSVQPVNINCIANFLSQNTLDEHHWGSNLLSVIQSMNQVPNYLSKQIDDGTRSPEELVTNQRPEICPNWSYRLVQ